MAVSLAGFQGLSQNTGRRQSAQRELNTLRQLHDFKKQGEMEEQQAEVAYQETLASVKAQADTLLEGDRLAINKKADELQMGLRQKIQALGGSKKSFLKNGGISDLANYKDQVLGSDEMFRYKNNKVNMEKLLMIKERKMGHLINERDYKSMIQYQKDGKGELTYTGLLNEVEVDQTLFEFGQEIKAEDVLKAGSNRMAIIANYEADTGQTYNPSYDDKDLKAYVKYKGYGGIGKNVAILNSRIARIKAEKDKRNKKKNTTVAATIGVVVGKTGEREYNDMDYAKGFGNSKLGQTIVGMEADRTASHTMRGSLSEKDNIYKLKGGGKFGQGKERDVAQSYYNLKELNEDGSITLDPTNLSATYASDGVGLAGKNKGSDYKGNYVPSDLVLAYKTMVNGEPHLIVEATDRDGNIVEDNTELYGDGKPKGIPTMVIRMKHQTERNLVNKVLMRSLSDIGADFYQEVDVDSTLGLQLLGKHFGEENDLTVQNDEQNLKEVLDKQDVTAEKQVRAETKEEEELEKLDKSLRAISDKAIAQGKKSETINSEYFRLIKEQFDLNGVNRGNLVQSFYQAYAKGEENDLVNSADGKLFNQALDEYDLKDVLLDKNVTDEEFIQKYYKADLKANPGSVSAYSFAKTFKQIYDKNINPDKD